VLKLATCKGPNVLTVQHDEPFNAIAVLLLLDETHCQLRSVVDACFTDSTEKFINLFSKYVEKISANRLDVSVVVVALTTKYVVCLARSFPRDRSASRLYFVSLVLVMRRFNVVYSIFSHARQQAASGQCMLG
jgi:ABC-type maltose transport system permease subunit